MRHKKIRGHHGGANSGIPFTRRSVPLRVLLTLAAIAVPNAALAEGLTFSEAVSRMRANNEAITAAQDEIVQRREEKAAAAGMRYPKVEIEARETFLNDPIKIGVDPIPLQLTVQDDAFTEGQAKASLMLYTGGRITAANNAAAARLDEAGAQARVTEHTLLAELAQRYFGMCLAQRNRVVQALKLEAMRQHEYRARRLMEEGIIARVEHLNAKVALANAQSELDAADSDIAIVAEGLANSVAGAEPVEPLTTLFILDAIDPCETFQDYVEQGHPILDTVAAKRYLAEQGIKAEKGANRPAIYLFGMHELFPDDLTMLDPKWAAGLGFQHTLFDGGQGKHKVLAAKAQRDRVIHLQAKARRDLKSLVLRRYEELQKARSQYISFTETLELSRENLRVRARAFEEGFATSVEVVDAALSHARAHLGRLKAAYDFDLALFQLLDASGRIHDFENYLAKAAPVPEEPFPTTPPLTPVNETQPAEVEPVK